MNSEKYYDNISSIFTTNESFQCYLFDTLEKTNDILSDFIKDKNSRILDLGCGIGSFINYLNNKGYINTTGIVNSQKLFNISKKKYNINIIKDDMINFMTNTKQKYDIIFNIESFGYVDINDYFRNAYNVLDKEGTIILKDYTAIGNPSDTGKYYGNYTFYNHKYIIKTAKKHNFKKISMILHQIH